MFTEWGWRHWVANSNCHGGRAERRRGRSLQLEPLESRCCLAAAVVLSDYEQLLIELVNRARADPAAEAARYGVGLNDGLSPGTITATPKQPLAPNQALTSAAESHSQDMLDRDFFDHVNPSGQSPTDRIAAAGYGPYIGLVENIGWGGTTGLLNTATAVDERHAELFRSSEHRWNMLRTTPHEIGTGVRFGVFTSGGVNWNASMATEDIALRAGDAFLTGVAYTDAVVHDQFYSLGEGIGGVTITAVNQNSGAAFSTQSGPSGGYALQVPAGTYAVTAVGGALGTVTVSTVVIGTENRKVDLVPAPVPVQLPKIAVDLNGTSISDGAPVPIDFGNVTQGQVGSSRTFTVRNTGAIPLALGPISLPAGFTLVKGLANNLAPGGTDTFTIELDGSVSGAKGGDVSFATNDADENPFNFAIAGQVTTPATPPIIADIPNLTTNEDTLTGSIFVTVASADFAATQLSVAASSSNVALVPNSSFLIGGSGNSRTLTIVPAANQFGSATITVTVSDPRGLAASDSFVLTVLPFNDPPNLGSIGDQFIVKNSSRVITFDVQDIDTPTGQLIVTATSSNEALFLAGGLSIAGTGSTRTLSLTPATGQEGTATVTVRVDDGSLPTMVSFTAWVLANPFPWYNAPRPMDVDNNRQVAPLDALLIINYLNAGFPTKILPTAGVGGGPGFLDTNGDNQVAPLDALLIINGLNAGVSGEGEGVSGDRRQEPGVGSQEPGIWDESLLGLLAVDAAEASVRRQRQQ